jgi:phosphoserine/homoserine phosphotransferase
MLCLDLEGVLVPEIWIAVAERTGIEDLRLTTRDVSNYDDLMRHRIAVMEREGLDLGLIQDVISSLDPLPGASEFMAEMRERHQVVILSDTFYEFCMPLMRKLNMPTLLCHRLEVDSSRRIIGYRLRQADPKRQSVRAFKSLNYRVVAAGDSYNDVPMLEEAHAGLFFHAPEKVRADHPRFPNSETYDALTFAIEDAMARVSAP